jgi:2-(1,2-epoxy-1,2-dihydrophenyl)acetyl-CoA isomerase
VVVESEDQRPAVWWELNEDGVGLVQLSRPPHNYIDADDVAALAGAFEEAAAAGARALVLSTLGKNFCAGASLISKTPGEKVSFRMYEEIPRLFAQPLPVVAAVQGAAVGAGLGLALIADFRVAAQGARFVAPFTRLGFHHGFGLTATLPRVVGVQRAQELLFSGLAVDSERALQIGLCDRLVAGPSLQEQAAAFAAELAGAAPLALKAVRRTIRGELAGMVKLALAAEREQQERLMETEDFREGLSASSERRAPTFRGR